MSRLKEVFESELAPKLQSELALGNVMEVPKITKITLNMGLGEAVGDKKILQNALRDLEQISGQKAQPTLARRSIAGFKIRDGWPIGAKVTLRQDRMYEFLERLISIAIPRIRDFRGIGAKQFDGRGNFAMGVTEQIIFPEIDYDQVDKIRGLDIVITTTARNDDEGRALASCIWLSAEKIGQHDMAKVSMIEREKKREKTVEKYRVKRTKLKAIIASVDSL